MWFLDACVSLKMYLGRFVMRVWGWERGEGRGCDVDPVLLDVYRPWLVQTGAYITGILSRRPRRKPDILKYWIDRGQEEVMVVAVVR